MARVRIEGQIGINKAKRDSEEGDRKIFLSKEIACARSPKQENKIWKLFNINYVLNCGLQILSILQGKKGRKLKAFVGNDEREQSLEENPNT